MAKKKRKEQIDHMTDEEYHDHRNVLRLLVRSREGFMRQRTAVGNRLGIKSDGTEQKVDRHKLNEEDREMLFRIWAVCNNEMKQIENDLKSVLKRFKFYNDWLEHVKGVGPNYAAWIIGEIDIRIATTPSKIFQFAGLNPSLIYGTKSVSKSAYKPEMGGIVGELPPLKEGEKRYRVLTTELIRGDKMTPGFVSPFNKQLRVVLLGRMATNMIQTKNKPSPCPYLKFYYDYKQRLENSETLVDHRLKGKTEQRPWKDVSPGHREAASRRYMVKQLLKDVYHHWRTAEGLPVRKPYAEEYLGKKHE